MWSLGLIFKGIISFERRWFITSYWHVWKSNTTKTALNTVEGTENRSKTRYIYKGILQSNIMQLEIPLCGYRTCKSISNYKMLQHVSLCQKHTFDTPIIVFSFLVKSLWLSTTKLTIPQRIGSVCRIALKTSNFFFLKNGSNK